MAITKREKCLLDELKRAREIASTVEKENLKLKKLLLKSEYDWTLPIIEENNELKEQLALALHDNERLIRELSYLQHITKHFTA